MQKTLRNLLFAIALFLAPVRPATAQPYNFPFTSGPIPMCDTSTFTANVWGVGTLYPPGNMWWFFTLQSLTINITSNHPQTLQIFLTSPQGTTLLLSQFNGAGGQNYTNTTFWYNGYPSIVTGSAPFTGNWTAQGGNFSVFDYENGDGVWTITVIDTACAASGGGIGGPWAPGWFNGGSGGNGGFAFGFSSQPPPPCLGIIFSNYVTICPGQTVDILGYFTSQYSWYNYTIYDPGWNVVANPSSVSAPGQYWIEAYDPFDGCFYTAVYDISLFPTSILGPDQVVNACTGALPVDLTALFTIGTMTTDWTLNGVPITSATAAAATAPGLYQVISTSPAFGCTDTAEVTLNVTTGPALGPDQTINTCAGSIVDLTTLYNTTGYTATWYVGGSPVVNPGSTTTAGLYTLIATDVSGCADTAEITLNMSAANLLGGNTLVWACHSGTYDLTQVFTTSGLTTNWYFGGNPVPNPAAVSVNGVYTLVAQDAFGCTDTADVTLSLQPYPVLGPDQSVSICNGGAAVNLAALFPLAGLTESWTLNGAPITNAAATAAGTPGIYQVIGQSAAGCEDTATVTLTVAPGPALGPDQSQNICSGTSVNLLPLYNTAGLTWAWYFGGNPFTTPSSASNAGVYSLIATDAGGCTDTADVTLNLLPTPSLGPDQNITACITGTYDLTALYNTSGLSANWYLNGSPVANPGSAGSSGVYVLVAANASGCSDTAEVTLNISQNPSLGPDQSTVTCSNTPADLTTLFTTGTNVASWYFGGSPVATPSATTTAGVYTLIITSAAGCTDTADVTLNLLPAPVLGPDQNISGCVTGTYDLTSLYSPTGTSTWYFSGNPVANPASVSVNGTYMLVDVNLSGCSDTALVTLNVSQNPSLGPDQNATACSNTSADLTALFSTGANTASWYFGGSPVVAPTAVTTAGVYTLIITTPAGCTDTALSTLAIQQAPALGGDQTQNICSNSALDLTTMFTTTGMNTSWSLAGNPVANPSGVAVAGIYTLVATTAAGCSDTAAVTLNLDPAPALGSDQSASVCSGSTVDLTALVNTTGLISDWTMSGIPVSNPGSTGSPGVYQLIAVDGSGCSDTALVNVSVLPVPALGPDQSHDICSNVAIDLTSLYNSTGLTAAWTLSGNAVANPGSVSTPGLYQLMVINGSGCSDSAEVTLNVNSAPDLGPDAASSICAGSTTDLTSYFNVTGLTAVWSQSGNPVGNPGSTGSPGLYTLIVTDAFGCSDTAQVTVTVNAAPSLGSDQSFALCPWQTVDLSAVFPVAGMTTTYTFNGSAVANFTVVYDSGTYVVQVTDVNGCTDEALAQLTHDTCLCEADFTFEARCMQEPVKFELQSDSLLLSAHWNFGGAMADQFVPDPEVKFNTTEAVLVTLQATLSCGVVTVQQEVRVTDCADSCHFYLPSAFTPNSDGKNDRFTWYGECDPEEFSMEIYNRFGQRVFFSDNPLASWDGKYENAVSPEGVYVYHISYRLPYQQKQLVSGTMMVVR